jgi:hypothetical protein
MFNPLRLCLDLFDDAALSDKGLQAFSEDHLLRIINNNPGAIYSTLISDTTTKYTAYYGKMSSQASQEAIKEGLTIAKNNARTNAEHKVSSLEGLVRFKFGVESQTYQEFYPHGLTEYHDSSDALLQIKFDRFVGAATTHLNADHPGEVTIISGLVTTFKNAHSAQNNAFSNIDNVITGKHVDRKALTMQLTKNFLSVAIDNIDNTDKYDDFFNPQLLPLRNGSAGAGVVVMREGDVNSPGILSIDVTGIQGNALTTVVLLVTGSPLRFYASATDSAPPDPASPFIDIAAGASITKTGAEFAALVGLSAAKPFLLVQNMGAVTGHYKLTFNNPEEDE